MIIMVLMGIIISNLALAGSYTTAIPTPVILQGIEFSGNNVFTEAQLQLQAKPFLNRPLTEADIEELRYRLTRLYIDNGYINSGAIVDGYDKDTRYLQLRLIEGILKEVQVHTSSNLAPNYVADRVQLALNKQFHLPTLQERLLLFLSDPLIESLNAELDPGVVPGEAILKLDVTERRPYKFGLTLDNYGQVSQGEKRAVLNSSFRNLTGWGEITNLEYGLSDGNHNSQVDFSIPLSADDTKFHASFEHSNALVIEEPVKILDIRSNYTAYAVGLSRPFINSLKRSLVLGLNLEHRTNKTWILDFPFSLTQGSIDGKSTVVPLRFTQEWVERDIDQTYSLRSVFSIGNSIFGATNAPNDPVDAKFLTWILQQRYSQQWWNKRLQFIGRLNLQLADSPLPIIEQLGLGGAETVRGYRENTLIRDQALLASLELRYRLLNNDAQLNYGQLYGAIFTDFAHGWNKGTGLDPESLHSIGLGLLMTWHEYLQASLYWGHPLRDPPQRTSGTWQDDGIHLQLQATY